MRAVLCHVDDIPDGQSRGFDPDATGRDTVFIVRQGERLHGYRNACPHIDGAPMAWRKDAYLSGDRRHIACHAHGARFDIQTGRCVLGPCLGQSLTPVHLQLLCGGQVLMTGPAHEETSP